jgi:predicted methyltransferase
VKKFLLAMMLAGFTTQLMAETPSLEEILQSPHRSATHKARDIYRHPKQTLTFFDIKPYMTVVEIWPGAGWYTEILAPYLKQEGLLYAAHFSPESTIPYFKNSALKFRQKLAAEPEIYGRVKVTVLEPPKYLEIAPAGSADRVLTFRNVHNWLKAGVEDQVFAAIYKALRPGGLFGVVEHRANDELPVEAQAESGYVHEKTVIAIAERAGFKLLDKSDINRNPKDDTRHPKGVWTLLPTLRLGEQDKAKYQAIGESDRMTLKFIKPFNKSNESEKNEKK